MGNNETQILILCLIKFHRAWSGDHSAAIDVALIVGEYMEIGNSLLGC